MKITGPDRSGSAAAPAAGRRVAAPGFSVEGFDEAAETSHTGQTLGVAGVGSVDALIALQEVDGPTERKRRAVRRAGRILDVLDEMKLALLEGEAPAGALQRLTAAVREERATVEDPGLHGVLDEIETRARVEMAKAEMARRAA
jgi:hypothetical protein